MGWTSGWRVQLSTAAGLAPRRRSRRPDGCRSQRRWKALVEPRTGSGEGSNPRADGSSPLDRSVHAAGDGRGARLPPGPGGCDTAPGALRGCYAPTVTSRQQVDLHRVGDAPTLREGVVHVHRLGVERRRAVAAVERRAQGPDARAVRDARHRDDDRNRDERATEHVQRVVGRAEQREQRSTRRRVAQGHLGRRTGREVAATNGQQRVARTAGAEVGLADRGRQRARRDDQRLGVGRGVVVGVGRSDRDHVRAHRQVGGVGDAAGRDLTVEVRRPDDAAAGQVGVLSILFYTFE